MSASLTYWLPNVIRRSFGVLLGNCYTHAVKQSLILRWPKVLLGIIHFVINYSVIKIFNSMFVFNIVCRLEYKIIELT